MSPAPETLRRQPNSSTSSLSISTILSRAPRIPNESPPPQGPFSADRRTSVSFRRSYSSGLRPPNSFHRASQSALAGADRSGRGEFDADGGLTRTLLLSALETRRRRIEGLQLGRRAANNESAGPERWRRQLAALDSLAASHSSRLATQNDSGYDDEELERFPTPLPHGTHRGILNVESSESDSDEDDDPENKFLTSMNNAPTTPPQTYLFQESSPTNQSSASSVNDDDSSRNAYTLSCRFCANVLTRRGMRARLVADARVHIWSTDEQP